MKKLILISMALVLSVFLMAGSASAELLGIDLGTPDIFSDTTGEITYDADTNLFTSTATALTITFDGVNIINIVDGSSDASYSVGFYVDESGKFTGGISGMDLEIYGSFTYEGKTYDGLLVGGEVTAFGWEDVGVANYSITDFLFEIDSSSALYEFYAGARYIGGDVAFVESDNGWDGTWDEDFTMATVKHDTGPVPEPATMLLLGSGLVGLSVFGRKKFFKQG